MAVTTNTRKLAALLGASGAGIGTDGTLTSTAIGEVIVAADIAENAIGASELDIANITGVLPSGVTGGSGLTALGTVTTGNISHADIVYPAGHVIQRVVRKHAVNGHLSLTSSSGWVSHGDEANIKFNFIPKSSGSTIVLEHFYGIAHTSTGGGRGSYAFTKDGNRNNWGGAGSTGYNDSYGHFYSGSSADIGLYHSVYGTFMYENDSTTQFELGMDIKWATSAWYYAHIGCENYLSATEYAGQLIV